MHGLGNQYVSMKRSTYVNTTKMLPWAGCEYYYSDSDDCDWDVPMDLGAVKYSMTCIDAVSSN